MKQNTHTITILNWYIDKIIIQEVILMETAAYIEELQCRLVGKIRTHGFPDKMVESKMKAEDRDSIMRSINRYLLESAK